uniref:Uncharacterized protein n=1 Tax=Parascaris equorum TaxID=6256 RepID=A0A914RKW4_PAREQ
MSQIGYLSATSSRNSHTKAVDWDQVRGSDALILTSVCRFPEHSPDNSRGRSGLLLIETKYPIYLAELYTIIEFSSIDSGDKGR